MALADATERVRALFAKAAAFGDKVAFDFGADGRIAVDGSAKPPKVSNDALDADCTISMTLADFDKMLAKELDPQMAFMTGKLSVKGNMGVAMNLVGLLKS